MKSRFTFLDRVVFSLLVVTFSFSFSFGENIQFYNPSFSCDNVKTDSVEYKICTNNELSKLDIKLTDSYTDLMKIKSVNQEKIKKGQIEWLKTVRDGCSTNECLKYSYKNRVEDLEKIINQKNKNDNNFNKIKSTIEDTKYKECLRATSDIKRANCQIEAKEKWELELNKLHNLLIGKIKDTNSKFYQELLNGKYYKLKDIKSLIKTLEKEYTNNHNNWTQYKESSFELLDNIYGKKSGQMWYLILQNKKKIIIEQRVQEVLKLINMIDEENF